MEYSSSFVSPPDGLFGCKATPVFFNRAVMSTLGLTICEGMIDVWRTGGH